MAKEEKKEKDEKEVEWTPDQPIPDEDGELQAQRSVMLERRKRFLSEQADAASKKKKEPEKKPWLVG